MIKEGKTESLDLIEKAKGVIRIEAHAVNSLYDRIGKEFLRAVELLYSARGRVIVSGLGKSGYVARKIASTLASTGTPAIYLHPVEGVHGDLGVATKGDVVIAVSKSGEMDELPHLLNIFKRLEVSVIAITGTLDSTLALNADVVLDVSVEEEACPHNLAPTASTTASLAMGDALAIALLLKRGFTYEDFALIHPGGSLGRKLLKVEDVMMRGEDVPWVSLDSTMKDAVIEMTAKRGITSVVDKKHHVVGVITNGDLMRLLEKTESIFDIPVADVMNKNPKIIYQKELGATAVKMMEEYGIISMPVVDEENRLKGVIHLHDLMRARVL
ncbi:MAG: SIS domain-containing protein [Candidatus Glassbacteria bacterium]